MKLPIIDSREIVPVRLIPFITNAIPGLATIPGILANRLKLSGDSYDLVYDEIEIDAYYYNKESGCSELRKDKVERLAPPQADNLVHAYRLNDNDVPVKMGASEWDAPYESNCLFGHIRLRAVLNNGVPATWRLIVSRGLPPGVFLWRDDLDLICQDHINTFSTATDYALPDFCKINYDTYIKWEYQDLAFEGFEHLIQTSNTSQLR